MDELNKQVEKLCLANRINRILAIAMMVLCVAALLLVTLGKSPYGMIPLAAGLVLLVVNRYLSRRYTHQAAEANLRYGLASQLAGFSYRPSGGITEDTFRDLVLFPLAEGSNRLMCRSFFSGYGEGRKLSGGEVTFHYKADSGGTAGYHFRSGTLLLAEGGRRSGEEDYLLLSDSVWEQPEIQRFLEQAGYRSQPGLPSGRRLYTGNGPAPTEELLRRLAGLPDTVTALRLTPSRAAAYLDRRFYTGSKYPAACPTPQRLRENTLSERDALWALFRWWLPAQQAE